LIRTRDQAGYFALQCIECGRSRRVLEHQPRRYQRSAWTATVTAKSIA